MEIEKFKEKHPLSYNKLRYYFGSTIAKILILNEDRRLFDFFDDNNLNIQIISEYYFNGINWNWQILWHEPDQTNPHSQFGGTFMYGDNGEYPVRKFAEQAAYIKAFEILENNLKKK